ncbi:MAG: DEAD/DEAH box helicase [Proteobacteria bacterium]|nr:DEAD/DEAH box helicase [Pseudomonadota bacterium]MDA0845034.1 DEAD/DEAH box helicase [Pseudomonadota bacterium]
MSQIISDAPAEAGNASGADFANFGLPETMLVTLAREGLVEPTPIQALSIPLLLDGKDLIGLAQTGTGKTAAFLLPLMTHLGLSAAVRAGQPPKALILAPTRELANQISQNVQKLAADLNIRHIAVFGGARYDAQIRGLRRGVDIVVATPGRLQDLMERGAFDPSGITHFILDEADHMLDLGFYPAIKRIAASLPARRQTMLFSATMPPEIEALGQQFLREPARVKAPQAGITADKITQHVTLLAEGEKRDRLCDILREQATGQALIFVRTKRRADELAKFLSVRGFAVDALHGDMRQTLRQKVLRNFRGGDLQALIATDVAARGIDVAGLSHVVNFDLTDTPEAYVHRIGRTGRAGLGGLALSFCAPDEQHKLAAIISVVGGRVELFEADGTRVEDFRAASAPSRQRRRGHKPSRTASGERQSGPRKSVEGKSAPRQSGEKKFGEKNFGEKKFADSKFGGRAAAAERSPAKPDRPGKPATKAPHQHRSAEDSPHDRAHGRPHDRPYDRKAGRPVRRKTDNDSFAPAHDKSRRPKHTGQCTKRSAGKTAPASAESLFSKRPKFTSRPSFGDAATTKRPAKDQRASTAGQSKKSGTVKTAGNYTGKPAKPRRDGAGAPFGRAGNDGNRPKKPGQERHGAAGSGASGSGVSRSGPSRSGPSRSKQGGHGRLKRRP